MVGTQMVHEAARLVRITAATFAVFLVVGAVALQSFVSQYDDSTPLRTDSACSADAACDGESPLTLELTRLETSGYRCTDTPSVTDVVVFQRHGASAVELLTFDQALEATSARDGWIRRYCVPSAG